MHHSGYKHQFKIDPARVLDDDQLDKICRSGTNGIIIGGTDGITYENSLAIYKRLRSYQVPIYQEISRTDAILPDCDGYLIPLVVNATDPYWLFQAHQQAVKELGRLIPWEKCQVEGYIVLNPDSKVAQLTKAQTDLSDEDVIAFARLVDRLLKLPFLYIEYSGIYGDPNLLRKLKHTLHHTELVYGGGIDTKEKADEMGLFAHTIVVGNAIYEDLDKALETVSRP